MQIIKGDLWDYHSKGWKIVITTNIGWAGEAGQWPTKKYANNMGAGIAWQAAQRWPWLPLWLGSHYRACHRLGAVQAPLEHDQLRLIFLPVKPLLANDPAYSWNQPGNSQLIGYGLGRLSAHQGKIALGFPGCGNGGLNPSVITPMLLKLGIVRSHLGHGETIVVDRQAP